MSYQIAMHVTVRRSADTEPLAREIEVDFRREAIGDEDGEVDVSRWAAKKRGGAIQMRTFGLDLSRDEVVARLRRIADTIDTNRNRVDRVDAYQVAAFLGDDLVGFAGGEFKGWQREVALEELDADRGVA